ncbi:MAG TPA: GNAT family N-acetyltransferase [Usitatibacter sp.]|nr:GNAT family N-acetyltransferase [Usitatibacter sp.]
MLRWRFAPFDELTSREIHDLYQARVGVFVVEQACPFQDVDGYDPVSWHLLGRAGEGLLAYCRLLPPGSKYAEASIGRVLTTKEGRGTGAGRELMAEALKRAGELWPGQAIRIGAQRYLDRFYGGFGFVQCSEPYDEDGIMHIEMLRTESRDDGKQR